VQSVLCPIAPSSRMLYTVGFRSTMKEINSRY